MTSKSRNASLRTTEAGFTLLELVIAGVLSFMAIGAALTLLDRQRMTSRTESLRMEVQQNARYAMDMITRDLQQAGQGMDATADFGPVATGNSAGTAADTLYMLYMMPGTSVHTQVDPGVGATKVKVSVTCADSANDVVAGKFLYLATGSNRGVVLIKSANRNTSTKTCTSGSVSLGTVDVDFSTVDGGQHGWVAKGNSAGSAATVVSPVVYYIDRTNASNPVLMRATDYTNGAWSGRPIADNISDLQLGLVFQNGTTAGVASSTDADAENNYDDINTVQVDLKASARRTDKNLNGGQPYTRSFRISVTPRNGIYTRNLQ